METIFLIDGSSLLSTSFYGTLPKSYYFAKTDEDKDKAMDNILRTTEGNPVNGVYTMTKTLLNIIQNVKPDYLSVSWDVSRKHTFRKKMYPQYKGTRKKTPKELSFQFSLMQELLDKMNIHQKSFNEFEADDILGTLSKKFSKDKNTKSIVLTKDQDALQLINENTSVWLGTKKANDYYHTTELKKDKKVLNGYFPFDFNSFKSIYGIDPLSIVDKKALEGDKSDNIPGINGIGPKVADPLIRHFKSIDNMYDFINEKKTKDAKQFLKEELEMKRIPLDKLKQGKDAAFLSKKLATIDCNIPYLDSTKKEDLSLKIDSNKMKKSFSDLEFYSLNDKF